MDITEERAIRVRRQTMMTQGRPRGGWGFTTDSDDTTYHCILSLETSGFDAIRLIYASDNQNDCDIQASVAVTAAPTDYFNPIDEQGDASRWIRVTFNNAGIPINWQDQIMGQINCTTAPIFQQALKKAPIIDSVPNLIGYTFSDWVPLSSMRRVDGGRWPLLMHRTHARGEPRPGMCPGGLDRKFGWGGLYGDRLLAAWSQQGDFVSNPAGFSAPIENGSYMPLAVQFHSRAQGCTIMNFGDSIAGGTGALGVSFAQRLASNLSCPDFPVTCFMVPWGTTPGIGPTGYFQAAKAIYPGITPSIVIPQLWSRNWGSLKNHADKCFQEAIQIGAAALQYGGQPIYLAPVPCLESYVGETEALRNSIVGRVRDLARGGNLTYDPNPTSELGTGEVPNSYQKWASDDQCHPNSAGHTWIARRLQELLERCF